MKQVGYILGALVVGVFVGLILGRPQQNITTTTKVDTVIYYKPLPTTAAVTEVRTLTLPRLLFAPADTVRETTIIALKDSVQVQVPIERRVYRDSAYYAVISGAVVGDIHPELVSIETYSRREVQVVEVKQPKVRAYVTGALGKESVGGGAGIFIANKHGIGVDYLYAGKGHIMGRYTFIF